jgi:predicted metalloprotease
MSKLLRAAVIIACAAALLTGCTTLIEGKPVSVFDDPFHVAGLPATEGPTGLRPDAKDASRQVQHSDGGKVDELGAQSISDIEEFWKGAFGDPLKGKFKPVTYVTSWDSNGYGGKFCDGDTTGLVNAAYCFDDKTIGWDRGKLLPSLRNQFGDMAITMVLAHEYGHAIQEMSDLANQKTPTLVAEQQADCFAGVYMRWVAEGNSERFTLSTGDGLNNLLAALISFRDPTPMANDPYGRENEHGSAFERISAFQFGFTDGVPACAGIDQKEIAQRRGDLPVALQNDQTGELPVTEQSVKSIIEALNKLFSPANPPQVSLEKDSCPDAQASPPASYCPSNNTIYVDLPELAKLGTKSGGDNTGLVFGDNTAYSVLVSRYMLAIQHERGGLVLDDAEAALRTACLTGVATTKMSAGVAVSDGSTIALTAGDLDEAVSGILTNGLVAADVNGDTVPSGFSRIDAFRSGVLGDSDRCIKRYK